VLSLPRQGAARSNRISEGFPTRQATTCTQSVRLVSTIAATRLPSAVTAQATDVMLDAIAHSDGSRGSVTRNLFRTRVSKGILGSFWITPMGDTTLNAVAVYRISGDKVTTLATVVVPDALVATG
jgi:hypothetical protein